MWLLRLQITYVVIKSPNFVIFTLETGIFTGYGLYCEIGEEKKKENNCRGAHRRKILSVFIGFALTNMKSGCVCLNTHPPDIMSAVSECPFSGKKKLETTLSNRVTAKCSSSDVDACDPEDSHGAALTCST